MPTQLSNNATKQTLALTRGPLAGVHGRDAEGQLSTYADKVVVPASTLATTEYLRFGKIPAGTKFIPGESVFLSNHSATIPGSVKLTPLDGTAVVATIATTINLEATTTRSMVSAQDPIEITKDVWVDFYPTSATTFAGTVTVYARPAFLTNS